jgi:pimeloyl-ACP methyl ester carboxylesterase
MWEGQKPIQFLMTRTAATDGELSGQLLMDLRSIGRSRATARGYDVANMAEDIHQLISKIKLEHVFIVGYDTGRHVAYAFVRRYPQITRGAMILAMFEMYRAFPANEKFNQAQRGSNDVPLFVGAGDGSPFARLVPKIAEGLRANGCTHVETDRVDSRQRALRRGGSAGDGGRSHRAICVGTFGIRTEVLTLTGFPPLSNSIFRSLDKGRVLGKASVLDCMAALPKSPAVNNAIRASLPAKVTDHFQLAFTSGRIVRCSAQPCPHLCAKIVSL